MDEVTRILIKFHIEELNHPYSSLHVGVANGKGKAIPLQAWIGPEGSRRLRIQSAQKVG
jgi:hypothetical protein